MTDERDTQPAQVWAVMPVYRPGDDSLRALEATVGQVSGVVIVDDGSGPESGDVLDRLRGSAVVIPLESNSGIGAALNIGVAYARDAGATHVLFVDQDSAPQHGFVDRLIETWSGARDRGVDVGSVVPEYFSTIRQARPRQDGLLDAVNGIQSGMLVPTETFDRIGVLRSEYFIDLVDTEFELRMRRAHLAALASPRLRLEHQLGHRYRRHRWHGWYAWLTLHPDITLSSPFRYYYRLRNRVALNREYFWSSPWLRGKETIADLIHFADTIALSTRRGAIVRLYRRALGDAVRGRMGRMPDDLAGSAASIGWRADRIEPVDEISR